MTEEMPVPKYSKEKYDSLYQKYAESPLFYSEEAVAKADYLRKNYSDFQSYAFYHILGGSSIDESLQPIIHEDFPGEDSVEAFIDNRAARG